MMTISFPNLSICADITAFKPIESDFPGIYCIYRRHSACYQIQVNRQYLLDVHVVGWRGWVWFASCGSEDGFGFIACGSNPAHGGSRI